MENNIDNLLVILDACYEAKEWAKGKTWTEIYNTCHRGDWLLWLFKLTNPNDLQLLILAKGHCVNTIRHLMKDDRSIQAVDAAIAFGEGKIGLDELNAAAYAARAARDDYYASAARVAYYASFARVAYYYAAAAASAADTASSSYASYAALKKNQQETADICRKYLPIEIWNIKFGNLKLK